MSFTEEHCRRLRALVQDCLAKHLYTSAVFYADKLVTLSGSDPSDVYMLAQAYFVSKQFRRAIVLLKAESLLEKDQRFRYLAARCLAESKEWDECLQVLGDGEVDEYVESSRQEPTSPGCEVSLYSAICLLRGRVFEALENAPRAIKWYQTALKHDPFCYEAFQALVERHLLSNKDEQKLVLSLKFSEADSWLQLLYSCKCKKYDQTDSFEAKLEDLERNPHSESMIPSSPSPLQPSARMNEIAQGEHRQVNPSVPEAVDLDLDIVEATPGWGLTENVDVLTCKAEWLYYRGAYDEAHQISQEVLDRDPYASDCIPIYLASCLELNKRNELFLRAHKLTKESPESALSWYAIGVYYMCTEQFENARRYFGRANSIDRWFAPAWVGFGNAFAAQDESDQAMAAYRTAYRCFPGLHLPLIYMGMEYMRMNNLNLAQRMFMNALDLCPTDPLVCNELGVFAYRSGDYSEAVAWLRRAQDLVPGGRATAGQKLSDEQVCPNSS
ncbi:unnamed protein product [Ostreobium quekettii]|uniref:Anaphase-promoting complex subunit 6 n=1 Tax=Ostreobium quekettii TaxID=121088 RepID=A0A8S1JCK4_9CHLO|nr:unnamed protein product [Ostreobium quekettii]